MVDLDFQGNVFDSDSWKCISSSTLNGPQVLNSFPETHHLWGVFWNLLSLKPTVRSWKQAFCPKWQFIFEPLIFGGYLSFREGWQQNSTRFSKRLFFKNSMFIYFSKLLFKIEIKIITFEDVSQIWFAHIYISFRCFSTWMSQEFSKWLVNGL